MGALTTGVERLGERAPLLTVERPEPGLGHAQRVEDGERDRADTAQQDGQAQVDERERDAGDDAEERRDPPDLGPAQVDPVQARFADLVGEPGVVSAPLVNV